MSKRCTGRVQIRTLNNVAYNPRTTTREALSALKISIRDFTAAIPAAERGSGFRLVSTVTVNRRGSRIVGGHQRVRALIEMGQDWIDGRDITWVDLKPDSGMEKALNVALNSDSLSGRFDQKKLSALLADIRSTDAARIETLRLDTLLEHLGKTGPRSGTPEIAFSEELLESQNYIVLFFENDVDWLAAKTHFEIVPKYSKRSNGKPWSKGIGRVLSGAAYLARLRKLGVLK